MSAKGKQILPDFIEAARNRPLIQNPSLGQISGENEQRLSKPGLNEHQSGPSDS
jgi:hypothetical protein